MKKLVSPQFLIFLLFGSLLFLGSCNVLNPNIMLVAGRHYPFDDSIQNDTTVAKEYHLHPNDIIEFRLFANDGYKMVDLIGSPQQTNAIVRTTFEYPLDYTGVARLPIIGNVLLAGMTIREAEMHLETRYAEYYVKPFVQIKVINKRVIIYPGEPGQARVITLENNNTSVLEALAMVGGISGDGKARNVKLIRQTNDPKNPVKVYRLNLSRINPGLAQGNTIVQSNDIIYVEPRRRLASKTLNQVTPVISLVTSLITFYYLIYRLH